MDEDRRMAWLEDAVVRWEQPLLRLCSAYLGDAALAEDALQETMLKAYRGYLGFKGESEEKTWLMRIAINTCKDIRRSAWHQRIDRSLPLDKLPEIAEDAQPWDDTVARTVMALPPRQKEVVLLHVYQGLTIRETAAALGIPRSTVQNRLNKAYALLRKELEAWYHDE